jgi:hypothetical protein
MCITRNNNTLREGHICGNNRGKVTIEQASKTERGSRGRATIDLEPRRSRGGGGQGQAGAALTPRKIRYPLYRKMGRPLGRSGRLQNKSKPSGFDSRRVQVVPSRYTD